MEACLDTAMVQGDKAQAEPQAEMHCLVVDDESLSRTVVANLLRKFSFKVTTAASGLEALDLLRRSAPGTFQLVLTDVVMPEIDGIQLLKLVKEDEHIRSVPVIMMSATEQRATVQECVDRGAEEYLVKPVTPKEAAQLWAHVARRQHAAATVPQLPRSSSAPQAAPLARCAPTAAASADVRLRGLLEGAPLAPPDGSPAAAAATSAAAPQQQRHSAAPAPDYPATAGFLRCLRGARYREALAEAALLAALDDDICAASARMASQGTPAAAVAAAAAAQAQQQPSASASAGSAAGGDDAEARGAKRRRTAGEPAAAPAEVGEAERVRQRWPGLEPEFFARRAPGGAHLDGFARDLARLAGSSSLTVRATVRSGDLALPSEMACAVDFDRDDEFFACVGVSRRIKVFDFRAVLSNAAVAHYPALQITTRSKLSSVSWCAYVKGLLATADYAGLVQLWDATTGAEVAQHDEHAARVWSVDFSPADPLRLASGGDDGTARLWRAGDARPAAVIRAPANVCSVKWSPTDAHLLAFGCANHKCYLYDARRAGSPLATTPAAPRAVSYVRWLGARRLVAASTDSTIRLWDLDSALRASSAPAAAAAATAGACVREFSGHRNRRNFVGLAVADDGSIACGSEDNAVYCYYDSLPFATARHELPAPQRAGIDGHRPFVSAVCWARHSRHLLAANSQGMLQVLQQGA